MRMGALLAVLGALLLWNCRGKEGPQGPPGPQGPAGQNLTRSQEGYIRGTVKGRDTTRNQDFQLSFNYTYVPTWISIPGTWTPRSNDLDTIQISLSREGEGGGYMSIELEHKKSTNTTWVTNLYGDLLDISSSSASRYRLNYYSSFSQDTAYVTSLTLRGDTLVSGQLVYVKRSKTPADTATVEFSSRIYRLILYQRQGQAQKLLIQQAQ
jgi:hypothetical protein